MRYTHVIWDWNGTLLNDLQWCIDVENALLAQHGMKTMDGVEDYHKVFCFPIRQYYLNLGYDFDEHPFEALSAEYIERYHSDNTGNCGIFPDVLDALKTLSERGVAQVILSASQRENLLTQVRHAGIEEYFDEILGLNDIYARSKVDVGLEYLMRNAIERAVLIGDTAHDLEVARALNTDCLLIARGHQSRESLYTLGVPVVDSIAAALKVILD